MKYLLLLLFLSLPALAQTGSFETEDLQGSTTHFNGTVGTTAVQVPAVAGNIISEVLIHCPLQTPKTKKCLVSLDGSGTGFLTLEQGTILGWATKGEIKQIDIKGNEAGVDYEIVLNRETW
jgi:hypothetical protein